MPHRRRRTTLLDLRADIDDLTPGIIALRRELHQHPELAFEEVGTAAILAGRMKVLGLAVRDGIGGTGGHDANSAVVAGVAEVLARHRARIAGRIAVVFQPADEPMRGARRMIEDGLLERVSDLLQSTGPPLVGVAGAGPIARPG